MVRRRAATRRRRWKVKVARKPGLLQQPGEQVLSFQLRRPMWHVIVTVTLCAIASSHEIMSVRTLSSGVR